MLSRAYEDELFRKLYLLASEETEGLTDEFCMRCHSPIGVYLKEIPPADGSKLSEVAKRGVSCDFCHTVSGYEKIGNGNYKLSPGMVKLGPFKESESPGHETAYSELHTKSEFCGICHNLYHPTNNIPLESTYTEWKEGPYAEEGVQCQDCHMRQSPGIPATGITKRPDYPGIAGAGGGKRPHLYTHYFVGANTIPQVQTDKSYEQMAMERLRAAATLEITLPANITPGTENALKVKITNAGAGHYLPTGLTELRQMWLYVKITDGSGKVIYESGTPDNEGNIDKTSTIYHSVFADKDGNPTEKVWEIESPISDNRIPPKESVTEEHSFTIPAGANLPLNIEAVLKYRSAPQHLVDELFGEGKVTPLIVDMVTEKSQIK